MGAFFIVNDCNEVVQNSANPPHFYEYNYDIPVPGEASSDSINKFLTGGSSYKVQEIEVFLCK